jgi:hypothetical protein
VGTGAAGGAWTAGVLTPFVGGRKPPLRAASAQMMLPSAVAIRPQTITTLSQPSSSVAERPEPDAPAGLDMTPGAALAGYPGFQPGAGGGGAGIAWVGMDAPRAVRQYGQVLA